MNRPIRIDMLFPKAIHTAICYAYGWPRPLVLPIPIYAYGRKVRS